MTYLTKGNEGATEASNIVLRHTNTVLSKENGALRVQLDNSADTIAELLRVAGQYQEENIELKAEAEALALAHR